MFGISGFEFLLIALVALLLFGPDKLPQFGRTIGNVMRQFNEAKDQMEQVVRTEMGLETKPSSPFATPSSAFQPPAEPVDVPTSASSASGFEDDEDEEEEE